MQVVPEGMEDMLEDADAPGARRAMTAMLKMKKIDMDALQRAYDGR
jgi:predicted 3-demethylubiquinone-9 3-methyltransferase (glyoxalase superfamily)